MDYISGLDSYPVFVAEKWCGDLCGEMELNTTSRNEILRLSFLSFLPRISGQGSPHLGLWIARIRGTGSRYRGESYESVVWDAVEHG